MNSIRGREVSCTMRTSKIAELNYRIERVFAHQMQT